jgi:hypothetical protein
MVCYGLLPAFWLTTVSLVLTDRTRSVFGRSLASFLVS